MSAPSRLRFRPALAIAIWVSLSVVFTLSGAATAAVKNVEQPLSATFWWYGADWLLYGLLSPAVFWLVRRLALRRDDWLRGVPPLLLGWLTFHLVEQAAYLALQEVIPASFTGAMAPAFLADLPHYLVKRGAFALLPFSGIVVVAQMGLLYGRVLERERVAAELEAALTRSRLDALRGQLQPHFLFNTLNTVSSLLRDDPDGAERVLARLGDLLRMSLQDGGRDEVSLDEELAFLERYVDIQRVRFADRLTVVVEADPAVRRGMVPSLLLQPLVENAIRHGIEPRSGAGTVRVRVARHDEQLVIEVVDDGVGITADGTNGHRTDGHGVGLQNTMQRLAQMYGDRQRLEIAPGSAGGTVVRISLPWREAEAADDG